MKLPHPQSVYTTCSTPFFNLQHWGGCRRKRNDQIGRAAVAPLFMRISVALSVILLHLICVLKEKGTDREPRDED